MPRSPKAALHRCKAKGKLETLIGETDARTVKASGGETLAREKLAKANFIDGGSMASGSGVEW